MAQHDYDIANQSGANFRADLNNALDAIVSNNSGSNEPSTKFAYEWWVDTTNDLLKIRNSANNAWITLPLSVTADNSTSGALTVNGNLTTTGSVDINGQELILDADADTSITADSDDQIDFRVGGTDVATLTNSHLVLKGTTPKITIGDGGAEDTALIFDGNAQDFYIALDDSEDDLVIGTGSTVGTNSKLIIENGGNVIVGATSYNNDNAGIGLGSSGFFYATRSGSLVASFNRLSSDGTVLDFRNDSSVVGGIGVASFDLTFETNSQERLRIASSGLIGVRNSSPTSNGSASDTALIHHHSPATSGWAISHYTNNTTGSAGADGLIVGLIGTDYYLWSYDSGQIFLGHSGVTYAKVDSNGDFYTNDGTVHSLSDKRIKKNIQPITEGLDVIKQLNPITFEYCNTNIDSDIGSPLGMDDGKVHKGFIADEVQEIAPSYVDETTGLVMGEEVNDLKSLSMTAMIPMLVKAIQEQQDTIEDLKSRIETLEG